MLPSGKRSSAVDNRCVDVFASGVKAFAKFRDDASFYFNGPFVAAF
jgi:hypothetical protein